MSSKRNLDKLGGDRRFELLVNAVKDYAIYLLDRDGSSASTFPFSTPTRTGR
jgi:hypothetical protein